MSDTPYGPVPAGMVPPPPSSQPSPAPSLPPPPPPGYESHATIGPLPAPGRTGPTETPRSSSRPAARSRPRLGYLLVAVVLTLALGVGTFFVVRGLIEEVGPSVERGAAEAPSPQRSGPGGADDEPTTGSSAEPFDEVAPTVQQCTGGLPDRGVTGQQGRLMTGGGLQLPTPEGFAPVLDQSLAFTFADGVYAPSKLIEENGTAGWVALYALGSLSRANGFDSPRQAAEVVVTCMSQSGVFYSDFSSSTPIASAEGVVDGNPAWDLTQEIRIEDPALAVEGDVVRVVVVDTDDPASYALFVSVVPIGDLAMIAEQEASVAQLEVR